MSARPTRESAVSWIILATLVAGVSILLTIAGFPSALLFGGLLGGLVFALATGRTVAVPGWTFTIAQAIIGVTVGASVDLDVLADLGSDWPAVIVISVVTLLLSVLAGQLLRLHRGVTPVTASFASVAGGASGMTAVAHDLGADDRVVTVIQYLRVLVVLLAMPAAVSMVFDADTGTAAGAVSPVTTTAGVVYSVLAVGLGLVAGRVLHLPSPAVLGALLASVALGAVPVFADVDVPVWVQAVGFLLIGLQVGLRFTLDSLKAIGRMLPTALLVIAIIIGTCAAFGVLLAELTGVSELDAYLATTPGGLYAVLATSADTGGNVTFVTAVQIIRLLLVLLAAPLLGQWLTRRER
ncbi:AbrB family transcriptional regulator [Aeromicrobium chenweiae]|uniref:Ammonia monooxygenase n=1 Tax=Aeromicrobium chenweiae TaxID=2079793 RepID=A0A2S0WMS0_9ACTN|nr:AbrB family transcriptional regulator [Aeromicrobium chenweiae]AWB92611.1 ammonia monooxygenase [Aeromicrobium chenweiae]TGN33599.1 AbrB family transcriptional regulator [Aeromicrobium chenweiae]